MTNVKVGKYVKTHGIKGEIKILSDFKYKERAFQKDNHILIGNKEFIINSYRTQQEYSLITLKGIENINDILPLKGNYVYINRDSLKLNALEYLDSDLINMKVFSNNEFKGLVSDIVKINAKKKLLVVNSKYVPFELIKKVSVHEKKIEIEEVIGLL